MRKIAAAFAVIALLPCVVAHAGVVLEEEEAVAGPPGQPGITHKRTVMVQGHREKMVTDERTVIIDLDKGTMTVMIPRTKTYFESAFPPSGASNQMIRQFMGQNFDYKKTGGGKTIAGYKCEEYANTSKTANGEFSTTACYSKDAPGASDYAAFQKAAALKLAGGSADSSGIPEGVPLATHSSRKITSFSMPGMSPEQAARLNAMIAKRPPVISDSTVTKITSQNLAADTFAVPADYTKREMPSRPPGHPMGGGPMMHPPGGGMSPMSPSSPPPGAGNSLSPSAPPGDNPPAGGASP